MPLHNITVFINQVNKYGYHDVSNRVSKYEFAFIWHIKDCNDEKSLASAPRYSFPSDKKFGCSIIEYRCNSTEAENLYDIYGLLKY